MRYAENNADDDLDRLWKPAKDGSHCLSNMADVLTVVDVVSRSGRTLVALVDKPDGTTNCFLLWLSDVTRKLPLRGELTPWRRRRENALVWSAIFLQSCLV